MMPSGSTTCPCPLSTILLNSILCVHPSQFSILRLVLDLCNLIIRFVLDPCITRFHRFNCNLDCLELLDFRGFLVSPSSHEVRSDHSLRLDVCKKIFVCHFHNSQVFCCYTFLSPYHPRLYMSSALASSSSRSNCLRARRVRMQCEL